MEIKAIALMTLLRDQGHSYREIVNIMNDLKIPCQKSGAKWHVRTEIYIFIGKSDAVGENGPF